MAPHQQWVALLILIDFSYAFKKMNGA